jgi:hypothetical protein
MLRVYDEFLEDEKICALHDRSYRVHMSGLIYAAKNLTDGQLTEKAVKVIQAILEFQVKRYVVELVEAGLWVPAADGYEIKNFLEFNPRAATVKKERAMSRNRMRKMRDRRADVTPEHAGERSGEGDGERSGAVPYRSLPDLSKGFSLEPAGGQGEKPWHELELREIA